MKISKKQSGNNELVFLILLTYLKYKKMKYDFQVCVFPKEQTEIINNMEQLLIKYAKRIVQYFPRVSNTV